VWVVSGAGPDAERRIVRFIALRNGAERDFSDGSDSYAVIEGIITQCAAEVFAGTPAADRLEVLVTLVEAYEAERWPIDLPDPVAAIVFRMEQQGLTRRDLEPYLGGRGRVSEVLTGKRALTLAMIRKLHAGLGIPLESLIGPAAPSHAPGRVAIARSDASFCCKPASANSSATSSRSASRSSVVNGRRPNWSSRDASSGLRLTTIRRKRARFDSRFLLCGC
jgi:HTH-type transcriptional regulator / antitoxin HigA